MNSICLSVLVLVLSATWPAAADTPTPEATVLPPVQTTTVIPVDTAGPDRGTSAPTAAPESTAALQPTPDTVDTAPTIDSTVIAAPRFPDAASPPITTTVTVTAPTVSATSTLTQSTGTAAEPTATPIPSSPGTAQLGVLISDSVVTVQGIAHSEVFCQLVDVMDGIQAFELYLTFDPAAVQVIDADGVPANGVQIAAATFFTTGQTVTANQVDNESGTIVFGLAQPSGRPTTSTRSWVKVGTITWQGLDVGNAAVSLQSETHFTTVQGARLAPTAAHGGTVFVRSPGQVTGQILLQGRTNQEGVRVSSALTPSRVDKTTTDPTGRFSITASHGEGFYSLQASSPGYLSAGSEKPVKLTVGSTVELEQVTLFGGDVTGDDRIDIRDLSYIAWHFDRDSDAADINGDGRVDILDLSLTASNFGRVGPTVWRISD